MNRFRLMGPGLAVGLSALLLMLLLGYEALLDQRQSAGSGAPVGQVGHFVQDEADADPGQKAAVVTESPAAGRTGATVEPPENAAADEPAATTRATEIAVITATATPALRPVIGHTVEAGQTLATIADQYATTVEILQKLNGIIDPNYLPLGQELMVPEEFRGEESAAWPTAPVVYLPAVIGLSANRYPIESFVFGDGHRNVVVIGGIHGGYEWNSVLLAYRFLDYFGRQPEAIPEDIRLHIIPTGNPDGLAAVTGQVGPFAAGSISGDTTVGRLNGNGVDLNRNWGCDWSAEALWRQTPVSGGSEPFSEPESRALRDYLSQPGVEVVIWLHSAAGLVIPAACQDVIHEPSLAAAALYGEAAGYPVGEFTAYPISGDAGNWLAQQGIASITVELSDHQNVEMDRNLVGLLTLLEGLE